MAATTATFWTSRAATAAVVTGAGDAVGVAEPGTMGDEPVAAGVAVLEPEVEFSSDFDPHPEKATQATRVMITGEIFMLPQVTGAVED